MSQVFDKIIALLDAGEVPYQVVDHPPVFTSQEAAQVRGTPLKQGAKAMVFEADGRPVLLVVAAHRRIDTKAFKKLYQTKNLRLIRPEEVERITGLEVGSIPPLGNVLGLPTYVDESLLENQEITFNAGSHTRSVIMACQDYLSLMEPEIGSFSTE